MLTDKTVSRLRAHAGFEDPPLDSFPSVARSTWPSGQVSADLPRALLDLLDTIEILNQELNGKSPSSPETAHVQEIPRNLVYAITEVERMLRESQEKAGAEHDAIWLRRAAWRVEAAWSAVLAGDIDDLRRYLEAEEAARFE